MTTGSGRRLADAQRAAPLNRPRNAAPKPIRAAPDEAALPASPIKGRGAVTNRPGRYERGDRPREDD
ncbi:MAG: hypothetical protein WD711_05715, partial [Dongiaceae bacterium]